MDADRVYVLFQTKSGSPLTAYDHDGKQLWQIDFGPYLHGQGGAVSPIVHGDMVIVANDHAQGSFLIAVDRATGKTIWKIPREGNRACYSTPCIFQPADREPEIIFTHCYEGVTGVIAKTGVTNWTLDPFGRFKQRAVGSPIIAGDLIIATSGFTTAEKNVVVLRTDALDGATTAKEIYRVSKLAPHIPTPLVYRDRLFLWTDTGIVSAYELKTGEELWKGRVGGNFYGSPVCVNGNLYCCDRDGVVSVVSAVEDDFELIATNKLGGPSRATPAVSDGVMYLRSDAHVVSLGGKASE
ncbi:MAG: PQQ-binding-like beta-propeller repeat protein [Planctomycetales bacterium]